MLLRVFTICVSFYGNSRFLAKLLNETAMEKLYENEPGLWGSFARGALAMHTENIQPK